jgi:light-regulated signal transduction histidine kinase (bacteriophytochrome)
VLFHGIETQTDAVAETPEEREAIFEAFRQGPDSPRHSPGVGVGLTLVARFAELHGGRAWVESRNGGGASFRVSIPRRGESGVGSDDAAIASQDGAVRHAESSPEPLPQEL